MADSKGIESGLEVQLRELNARCSEFFPKFAENLDKISKALEKLQKTMVLASGGCVELTSKEDFETMP